jgi:hypothetical protein
VRNNFGTPPPSTLHFKPQTLNTHPTTRTSTAGKIGNYNNELDFDSTLSLIADGTKNPSTEPQRNAFEVYFAARYTDAHKVEDHNNAIQAFYEVTD